MHKQSNKHRRRQSNRARRSRVVISRSRRLRLEGMEGRLMLSTTADVDINPLDLTVAQFHFNSMTPPPGASYTLSDAAGNLGGYIETPYSAGPLVIDGKTGTPLPVVPRGADTNIHVSFPTIPSGAVTDMFEPTAPIEPVLDGQEYSGSPLDADLGTTPNILINEPHLGGFDLQPSVIPIWDPLPHGPILDSHLAGNRQAAVLGEEGGLIPIESVLNSMASLVGPQLSDVATVAPGDNESDEPDESSRLAANTSSEGGAISGELARAMAFEFAGGEPANPERATGAEQREVTPASNGNSRPMPREPFSAADVTTRHVVAHVPVSVPSQGKIEAEQMASVAGPLGGYYSDLHQAAPSVFERTVGWLRGLATSPNGTMLDAAAPLDSAHMAAFDVLGEGKVAARSSLGLEFSLRGALNATPLLMILALERIAASNSRRASRDERSPVEMPLRRAK